MKNGLVLLIGLLMANTTFPQSVFKALDLEVSIGSIEKVYYFGYNARRLRPNFAGVTTFYMNEDSTVIQRVSHKEPPNTMFIYKGIDKRDSFTREYNGKVLTHASLYLYDNSGRIIYDSTWWLDVSHTVTRYNYEEIMTDSGRITIISSVDRDLTGNNRDNHIRKMSFYNRQGRLEKKIEEDNFSIPEVNVRTYKYDEKDSLVETWIVRGNGAAELDRPRSFHICDADEERNMTASGKKEARRIARHLLKEHKAIIANHSCRILNISFTAPDKRTKATITDYYSDHRWFRSVSVRLTPKKQ